jgi:peptidoglycan/LPS O-acetylase OafA/YrhL
VKVQLSPLTGLRCFLALWVVVYHQTIPGGFIEPWTATVATPVFCLLRTGYVAVGLFFVLSGFVLSYNYRLDSRWTPVQFTRFGVARFARIYPAYAIGLVLVTPFVLHSLIGASAITVAKQAGAGILNWTLLQAWIPKTALSWNTPGWSLSVEAFFYLCFPFVGVPLWRISRLRGFVLAGSLIWAVALIAPAVAVTTPLPGFGGTPATAILPREAFWASLIKFNPLLQLPGFCIGILTGRIYHHLRRMDILSGRGYWFYVPGMLLELIILSKANVLPFAFVHDGLLLPIHALLILGLALGGGMPARFLSTRTMVFLGNASYAMYILQEPVFDWLNAFTKRLFNGAVHGAWVMALYLALVIGLSSLLLVAFEEPANRWLKKKLTSWFYRPKPAAVENVLA